MRSLITPILSFFTCYAQRVYKADYSYQTNYKIYFIDYESQADLKIYYINYFYKAGWRNKQQYCLLKF